MNTLTALEQGLQISRRASRFYVNYYWLRDNCRSAFHPQTRERVLDIWSRQSGPRPATAEIIDAELIIRWQDEDLESRFDLDSLEMTIGQDRRADPASLPRKLWYADHVDRLSRFSQPELEKDESMVAAWARSLLEDGVALVTDMRDGDESIADLARERHFRDCWLDPDELKNTYRQLVNRGLADAAEDRASPAPPWAASGR